LRGDDSRINEGNRSSGARQRGGTIGDGDRVVAIVGRRNVILVERVAGSSGNGDAILVPLEGEVHAQSDDG